MCAATAELIRSHQINTIGKVARSGRLGHDQLADTENMIDNLANYCTEKQGRAEWLSSRARGTDNV